MKKTTYRTKIIVSVPMDMNPSKVRSITDAVSCATEGCEVSEPFPGVQIFVMREDNKIKKIRFELHSTSALENDDVDVCIDGFVYRHSTVDSACTRISIHIDRFKRASIWTNDYSSNEV